jgi:hypothetical protein
MERYRLQGGLGPGRAGSRAYQYPGIVVATDGSLKDDERMGTAFVSMGNWLPARSVAVVRAASSTRPELTGIELALDFGR